MPHALAGLLVRSDAAKPAQVEEALQRQVLYGGALDTNLLELDAIDEATLAPFLARASGLPLAPVETFDAVDARARRSFPARLAERHGLVPFLLDGRTLQIACAYPVDAALLDEISFMLSLILRPHIAPEFRVRLAVEQLYGQTAPLRFHELRKRFGVAPTLYVEGRQKQAYGLEKLENYVTGSMAPLPRGRPAEQRSDPVEVAATQREYAPQGAREEIIDLTIDLEAPHVSEEPPAVELGGGGEEDVQFEEEEGAVLPIPLTSFVVEEPAGAPRSIEPGSREAERQAQVAWTAAEALARLSVAQNRDVAIEIVLRYARRHFEYAAAFVVLGGHALGWDAIGPSPDARRRTDSLTVSLEAPSALRTVVQTRGRFLGPPPDDEGTARLIEALGRDRPRTLLLLPIEIRDRVVAVLWAEHGTKAVGPKRAAETMRVAQGLAPALEAMIRARKLEIAKVTAAALPAELPTESPPPPSPEPEAPRAGRPKPKSRPVGAPRPVPPPKASTELLPLEAIFAALAGEGFAHEQPPHDAAESRAMGEAMGGREGFAAPGGAGIAWLPGAMLPDDLPEPEAPLLLTQPVLPLALTAEMVAAAEPTQPELEVVEEPSAAGRWAPRASWGDEAIGGGGAGNRGHRGILRTGRTRASARCI